MRRHTRWMLVIALLGGPITGTLGQEAFTGLFEPRLGERQARADYAARGYFARDAGRRDELCLVRHDFSLSIPAWQNERDEWLVSAGVRALDIETGARLPGTRHRFPDTLWDVRLGTTYRHRFDNDWIAGANLTLGSASDQPFDSAAELTIAGTGFLRIRHGERNAWLFFVNYASNRSFLPHVPLPGFGYAFAPSDELRGVAGLPFSQIAWEPLHGLTLEASYFVPRTIHAQIGYRVIESVKLYVGYDWDNERFLRADRRDDDDRLFYYEQRVLGGVRWDITEKVWLDCGAGFAFDRFFFEGEDYGDRGDHRLGITDGPLLMLQVGLKV